MRYALGLFLFFLATLPTHGQQRLMLAERPAAEKLAAAKDLIKSAETAPTNLAVGGYALIDIKLPGELTSYIVPGSDDCIQKVTISKGTAYEGWLVEQATGMFKWTRIEPEKEFDRVLVTGLSKGTQTLLWMAVKDGKAVVIAAFQFQVGPPTPPIPPKPPEPEPEPVPIPGQGFRVLFVVESKDLSTNPSPQIQAIYSKQVAEYLNSHTVKDGQQPEWRVFDKDTVMDAAPQVWKDAMARANGAVDPKTKYTTLPWLIVTNGKTGYEGPVPANVTELMKKLKEYGGQ